MKKFLTFIIALILLAGGVSYYTYSKCVSGACPFESVLFENSTFQNEFVVDTGKELDTKEISPIASSQKQKDESTSISSPETITPGPLKVIKAVVSPTPSSITPAGVTEWTNYERVQGDLSPLVFNPMLAKTASAKVDDMFTKQYFEHVSPSGVGVDDLAKQAGYAYIVVGENLAMGNFEDDKALVTAWMESPGHRANIMNSRFQEIGVSAKRGVFEGREVWLAVQEFGKPLASCPAINPSLKALIEIKKNDTESIETKLKILQNEIEAMRPKWGDAYNQKVNEYNSLVEPYNELVKVTRDLVDSYNAQVRSFNKCATDGE